MISPLPASGKRSLILRCESLHLEVAFSLRPGEYARIGSSEEMEIALPLNGLREEECQISCDESGTLWLSLPGGARVRSPDGFQAGPYFFAIAEAKGVPAQTPEPAPEPEPEPEPTPVSAPAPVYTLSNPPPLPSAAVATTAAAAASPGAFSMLSPAEAALLADTAPAAAAPPLPRHPSPPHEKKTVRYGPSTPSSSSNSNPTPSSEPVPAPAPRSSRRKLGLAAGAAAVLTTAVAVWFLLPPKADRKNSPPSSDPTPPEVAVTPSPAEPPPTPAPAPVPASTASTKPAASPPPAPAPASTPPPAAAASVAATSPFLTLPDIPLPEMEGALEDTRVWARETLQTIVWFRRMEATLTVLPKGDGAYKKEAASAGADWIMSGLIESMEEFEATCRANETTKYGGPYYYLTTSAYQKAIEPFTISTEAQAREFFAVIRDAVDGRIAQPVLRGILLSNSARYVANPEFEFKEGHTTSVYYDAIPGITASVSFPVTFARDPKEKKEYLTRINRNGHGPVWCRMGIIPLVLTDGTSMNAERYAATFTKEAAAAEHNGLDSFTRITFGGRTAFRITYQHTTDMRGAPVRYAAEKLRILHDRFAIDFLIQTTGNRYTSAAADEIKRHRPLFDLIAGSLIINPPPPSSASSTISTPFGPITKADIDKFARETDLSQSYYGNDPLSAEKEDAQRLYKAVVFVRRAQSTLTELERLYGKAIPAEIAPVRKALDASIYAKATLDIETRFTVMALAKPSGPEAMIKSPLYAEAIRADKVNSLAEARDFLAFLSGFLGGESEHDKIRGVLLAGYAPYQTDPAQEYRDGHLHTIRNKAFPGVVIDTDYPLSWYPREGKTGAPPTNNFGIGAISCELDVVPLEDPPPTPRNFRRTLESAADQFALSSLEELTLGGRTAFRFDRESSVQVDGGGSRTFSRRIYMVLTTGHSVQFSFQTYGPANSRDANNNLQRLTPLFDRIVASFIISTDPSNAGTNSNASGKAPPSAASATATSGSLEKDTFEKLKIKAEAGDPAAQYELAQFYDSGVGTPRDTLAATRWLKKSADGGYPEAQYYLGRDCLKPNHESKKPDLAAGLAWMNKAADQNCIPALLDLSNIYLRGLGSLAKKDPTRAFKYCQRAARLEDPEGLETLARYYLSGTGVKKDYTQALKYARLSAAKNYPWGHQLLGDLYETGRGVTADSAQAVKHYSAAAGYENPHAQFSLGDIFIRGRKGVPADPEKGEEWMTKAAWQHYFNAQAALAFLYFDGGVLTKDPATAAVWARIALDHAPASGEESDFIKKFYKEVTASLSREELRTAEARAKKLTEEIDLKISVRKSNPIPWETKR